MVSLQHSISTSIEPAEMPTSVRKLTPTAKLPDAAVLHGLLPGDLRVLKRRLGFPAEFVFDECFQFSDVEPALRKQFASALSTDRATAMAAANDDSGVHQLSDGEPVVRDDRERGWFRWFNYCRYRVFSILEAHSNIRLSAAATTELLRWEREVLKARSEIVRLNVPLVLAMAKRTKITGVDYSDLISEGSMALMRSVDKFDWARGFKFSTYACRSILKAFSRVATRTSRYRGHFPTEFDPTLEKTDIAETRRKDVEETFVDDLRSIMGRNLAKLTDVEEKVIRARFALESNGNDAAGDEPRSHTLEQVGEMIGVTKERVRQIQNKALAKLREVLESGAITA